MSAHHKKGRRRVCQKHQRFIPVGEKRCILCDDERRNKLEEANKERRPDTPADRLQRLVWWFSKSQKGKGRRA